MWTCADNKTCYDNALVCDGHTQCSDGSDEDIHVCNICPRDFGFLRQVSNFIRESHLWRDGTSQKPTKERVFEMCCWSQAGKLNKLASVPARYLNGISQESDCTTQRQRKIRCYLRMCITFWKGGHAVGPNHVCHSLYMLTVHGN